MEEFKCERQDGSQLCPSAPRCHLIVIAAAVAGAVLLGRGAVAALVSNKLNLNGGGPLRNVAYFLISRENIRGFPRSSASLDGD